MSDYDTLPIMKEVIHSSQSSLSTIQAPYYGIIHENEAASTTSLSIISPYILLFIVILAVIFFVSGLVHLLLRFLTKRPSSSFVFHSNRYPDQSSGPHTFQRQLQQLFRLHDSGLDQALIDALPVFCYNDVSGLKEQFDCAVCLCEFSEEDKLRLLPLCSHAFHIDCIDTWLLSNSTCPLCRRTLSTSNFENQIYNLASSSQPLSTRFQDEGGNGCPDNQKPEGSTGELFLSVRLGKFRNSELQNNIEIGLGKGESSSSSHLDGRRCYSMGAYQYIVSDSSLHVVLARDGCIGGRSLRTVELPNIPEDETVCGKRVGARTRGDSFSLSKVWLWSNRSKFHSSSSTLVCMPSSVDYSK